MSALPRLNLLKALLVPLALLAASCGANDGPQGEPALYRVDAAGGDSDVTPAGWLFGTIHALPSGTKWRRPAITDALAQSGTLMVEIADLDPAVARDTFARLSTDRSLPPLEQRVSPEYLDDLDELLDDAGVSAGQFRHVESWAAAISLSAIIQGDSGSDPAEGVDRALTAEYGDRPITGLETIEQQFSIFDRLDDDAQQDLLESLFLTDDEDPQIMTRAWLAGDTEALAGLMDMGLGDAETEAGLRKALLTDRNARWTGPIIAAMKDGKRPFVAVGAGHLGGPDGLIALLEARGWTVSRVH